MLTTNNKDRRAPNWWKPREHANADHLAWTLCRLRQPMIEVDKSVVDLPNIKRFPGGASSDILPNLQNPANPVPLMDIHKLVKIIGEGD